MGQAQSRVDDDEQHPAKRNVPGVRHMHIKQVTRELLEQLSGRQRPHAEQKNIIATPSEQLPQRDEESVVIIQQDPRLEDALHQSRRIGDLLLKNEQHETAEISRLAADLLDREYRAPLKDPPCLKEREACVRCYRENIQDALRCQDEVRAYSQCAQQIFTGN